ncbi:hypothetical protein [Deinococcus humi]|uniref:hypothetical protein n=1 Tax=Deinococcus humi TaxID=662880 RepID=UPI0019CE0141|nr:hypothetical protein GCM10008949_38800 [Deinococcus humi]
MNYTAYPDIPALASASNLIALCLRDDADLGDIFGGQGLLAALRPGTIVVNHATGDSS